ncbi:hypothetical protein [Georgenia sp. Z1491]|uniref:hypothetical protein n=1 Tax=Georgenia sp. Z1491 TaxID=3416707 RepID=UPI003CF56567
MPRKRPAVPALALVGALVMTACSAAPEVALRPSPTRAGPSWQEAAPMGSTVTVGGWAVTLGETEDDATRQPVAGVDLVAAPGDDQRIVSVVVDAVNQADGPLDPGARFGLELVTAAGASYPGSACEGEATVVGSPAVAPGERLTARWCTVVPIDGLEGAVWAVADGVEDAEERRYVRLAAEAPGQLGPLPVVDPLAGRSIELPAASGTPMRVGDIAVAVGPTDLAPELLPDEDGDEPVPHPGDMFIGTTLTVTNLGTEPVRPALGGLEFVDSTGLAHPQVPECTPLSRPTDPLGPIQPGGTAEISLCRSVPTEIVAGGRWQLAEGSVGWEGSYRYVELGVEPTPELLAASTAPEPGSTEGITREQPAPAGRPLEVGHTTVTIGPAETDDVIGFGDHDRESEARDGHVFVLADIEVVEDASGVIDTWNRYSFDVSYVDRDGRLHRATGSPCSYGSDDEFDVDDLESSRGGSPRGHASGVLCVEVGEDVVDGGAWQVTSYGPDSTAPRRYVATDAAATELDPLEIPVVDPEDGVDEDRPAPAGTPVRAGLWVVEVGPASIRGHAVDDEEPLRSGRTRLGATVIVTNTSSVPAGAFDEVTLAWIPDDGYPAAYGDSHAQCSWDLGTGLAVVTAGSVTHDVCLEMREHEGAAGHWEVRTTGWTQDPETEDLVEEEIVRYVAAG